jgi:hypothetical protein
MTVSQHELGKRFFDGETSGRASNVELVDDDDRTLLVGYGWAIYAERDKETGKTTYHHGWYGYSVSTSCQLSALGLAQCDERTERSPRR